MEQRELSLAEIVTGLEFGQMIAQAEIRKQALIDAQNVFVAYLRRTHAIGDEWELGDWVQGFVREAEEGKGEEGVVQSDGIEEAKNGD